MKMGMLVSRFMFIVRAVLANLRDAKKIDRLSITIVEHEATIKGLTDEFTRTVSERNLWKGRAGDYRMMVLGCLSKNNGYLRFQKDFMNPKIEYGINIKEDDTTVRLKTTEKREVKYIKVAKS